MPKRTYNICMVSDFYYPSFGGVESHIYNLSQCLIKRGHKVIVITRAHFEENRIGIRWMTNGLKVYYLPLFYIKTPPGVTTIPFAISNFAIYRNIFLREKIDIVHGHQSTSAMSGEAILHATVMGIKTVFTDHSLFGFGDAGGVHINKVMKFVLALVNHAISVSHTSRVNTVLRTSVDPLKVSVIPNAVDTHMFRPSSTPKKRVDDTITIVVVTRLVYRKGVTLLKQVIPIICQKFPNVKFIIGGDGDMRTDIDEVIETHRLKDRVTMLGRVKPDQVRNVLIQGDIFLNCSLTEAFGISIIEAASCGLLVVSTNVGGVPEVLPEHMMKLSEPNVDSIVQILSKTIREFDPNVDYREEFHKAVSKMYNWDSITSRTLKVYHRVINMEPLTFLDILMNVHNTGLFYGKICCAIVAVNFLQWRILEWLYPKKEIDEAIDFRKEKIE